VGGLPHEADGVGGRRLGLRAITAGTLFLTSLEGNEGGVVDVNHAQVEDIADLPGIDADTARRIVATRDGVGGFSSLEDLGMTMHQPGDVVERLRDRVVCIPL
jgi:DNA uptake protein ComE-like DNA-binding protein